MEIATKTDLKELQDMLSKILHDLDEIKKTIHITASNKSLSMSVKDVRSEYGVSEYTQRMARNKGHLPYRMEGQKDLKYSRKDVEHWIERKTI